MTDHIWGRARAHTITDLMRTRLTDDPDGPYLDVAGATASAREVYESACTLAVALRGLGVEPGDRVASVLENSLDAVVQWFAVLLAGGVAVPVNTAYKGEYLRHQLADSGAKVVVVQGDLADRAAGVVDQIAGLRHAVTVGEPTAELVGVECHDFSELTSRSVADPAVDRRPGDLATFIYTGGTTGPSKGCMLSHAYHEVLARQIGRAWQRTPDDVVWTPLPLFHFNALVTVVVGALVYGGRGAIARRFSVSGFWPEMNRTGATITSTLGTMATMLAHADDVPEQADGDGPAANRTLRLFAAVPMSAQIDEIFRSRFGVSTFSAGYGTTEASLLSLLSAGEVNKPDAAGRVNRREFDVRIFDDDDHELARGEPGEIVCRPTRPHVMFEGYWGRPEATVAASSGWWYHTGDIGIIDADDFLFFVDRKADYLRRRGENISSFEMEKTFYAHPDVDEVAVHAVSSEFSEDDVKVTVVRASGSALTEAELCRWSIDRLPFFSVPRYVEFRDELPKNPVGRILKYVLRDEGVTESTWDREESDVTFERR